MVGLSHSLQKQSQKRGGSALTSSDLGKASVTSQAPLVAGSLSTIHFSYTADHSIDDSGYLKIAFRSVSDFGAPQFKQPAELNYCTVQTTGNCRLIPRWDEKGHIRPWSRALFIRITGGYLDRGEQILLTFGERSGGSPGWLVQTFQTRSFVFKTMVDPIASYQFKELPVSPSIPIIAGPPVKAVCLAPSQVRVGQSFSYFLKLEDRWGNPIDPPRHYEHHGFDTPGIHFISADSHETGLVAKSNPVEVTESSKKLNRYWADLHGQSEETVGTGTIEDYFKFARDYSRLDICAHQGNDFQVTDEFWEKINQTTRRFYQPRSFVTFPGYEWSGNTPLGGDRNIYFSSEGGDITRSCRELIPEQSSRFPDSPTAKELFRNLHGPSPFVFAHVGGRYADLDMHDEKLEVAVEVHSAWGTFEWLVEEAFRRGYRIGITANSDGHKCRPGASYPGAGEFGSYGGLTCILAEKLDRESIHAAIMSRRFYATTGNRPIISINMIDAEGKLLATMGETLDLPSRKGGDATHEEIKLDVMLVGTASIERIEVRNGPDVAAVFRPYSERDLGRRLKILWSGAEVKGRARMTRWDGELEVKNNRILGVVAVNIWNALRPVRTDGSNRVLWKSATTGGYSGLIIEVEDPNKGKLEIRSLQGSVSCRICDIGIEPAIWEYGGLRKKLEVYRLPANNVSDSHTRKLVSFTVPLVDQTAANSPIEVASADRAGASPASPNTHGSVVLKKGCNPLYLCAVQEDGHMAWTSPVYMMRSK